MNTLPREWSRMRQETDPVTTGFALPAALLAIVGLFAILGPTAVMIQMEWRSGRSLVHDSEAVNIAEEGIEVVLASWDSTYMAMPVWGDTSFTAKADVGEWAVDVERTSEQLFQVEATGKITGVGALQSGAQQRVSVTVRSGSLMAPPKAALAVGDEAGLDGSEVRGWDTHPPEWFCNSPLTNQWGIVAPATEDVTMGPGSSIYGMPPTVGDPEYTGDIPKLVGGLPFDELTAHSDYRLAGVASTILASPDVTSPCQTERTSNWGDPQNPGGPCGHHFPIVHVPGSLDPTPGSRGQGVLVVEGDLTITGDFVYYGLIIVAGQLEIVGDGNRIRGAVYATQAYLSGDSSITLSSCVLTHVLEGRPWLFGAAPIGQRSFVELSGS